jgi:hypothetical protein
MNTFKVNFTEGRDSITIEAETFEPTHNGVVFYAEEFKAVGLFIIVVIVILLTLLTLRFQKKNNFYCVASF